MSIRWVEKSDSVTCERRDAASGVLGELPNATWLSRVNGIEMTATAGHRRISRIFHLLLRTRATFVPEEVRTAPVLEAGQIPFEDVLFATTHCGDFFWLQIKSYF